MDSECIKILSSIGFEDYIPKFEAALFTDVESIEELVSQPDLLAQVIVPVGHRAKFISKMGKLMRMEKGQEIDIDIQQQNDPLSLNALPAIVEVDVTAKTAELAEILQSQEVAELDSNYTEKGLLQSQEVAELDSNYTEKGLSSSLEEASTKTYEAISNDVKNLLQLTVDGKSVLALYESKGFDNRTRVKLASCVINAEYGADTNKVITANRFKELARQIKEIFPNEEESTYYVPAYTPRGGKTVIAKGKLYDKYTCLNKDLREANLRQLRPTQYKDIERNILIPENIEDNSDIEACLKFLETCLQPWDSIVDYWRKTSAHRLNDLLSDVKPHANVESYLQRYGCLKQPKGYTLLEIDFNIRFPEASLRVFSHWESFSKKLKRELSKSGVDQFESDADLIQKFVQLFSVCPVKVPKGKAWRASRVEIVQGFMLHIKVISDFEKEIQRINALATQKGFSVQPFPLVVGATIKDINSSYIVIDGRPILVETPLRALEVAFKCYFALNCEYPIQSRRQWMVLQKTLFDVHVPNDKIDPIANLPEVKRLIKTLTC